MNETKAKEMAQDLLNENLGSAEKRFDVTGSSDEVIVRVFRVRKGLIKEGREFGGWTVTPQGAGQSCPTCNGTGKI